MTYILIAIVLFLTFKAWQIYKRVDWKALFAYEWKPTVHEWCDDDETLPYIGKDYQYEQRTSQYLDPDVYTCDNRRVS